MKKSNVIALPNLEPVSDEIRIQSESNIQTDNNACTVRPIYDRIPWCSFTWNPVKGCTQLSAGCAKCYAKPIFKRFPDVHGNFNQVRCYEDRLDIPRRKRTPSMIFVVSMGDLFHQDVPTEFIKKVFKTMNDCPQHIFQVLTKRNERLENLSPELDWTSNIWCGVSVENSDYLYRIDSLRKTGATIKFLSIEPLIGPIPNMNLEGINWIICGGESGLNYRPMPHEWARDIKNQCVENSIPFFFKQSAGFHKAEKSVLLDGKVYHEFPSGVITDLTNNL